VEKLPPISKPSALFLRKNELMSRLRQRERLIVETFLNTLAQLKDIASYLTIPTVIGGALAAYWGWAKTHARIAAIILLIVGSLAYLIDISDRLGLLPRTTVYSEFKPLYETTPQFGRPLSSDSIINGAYEAVYDSAIVLWITPTLEHFVLPIDQGSRKVMRESIQDLNLDGRFFDDDYIHEIFPDTPKDRLPPKGGVARSWKNDEGKWKWIGWRKWDCSVSNPVHFQFFEHGIMLGPMPLAPSTNQGRFFAILLESGTWSQRTTPISLEKCS